MLIRDNFHILILILISFLGKAQIPNGGFENWTFYSSFYDPNNWCTYNFTTSGPNIYTTTRGMPGFSGNYFLSLETKTFVPSGYLNGIALSGQYVSGGGVKGIPISTRYNFINGVWKYLNPVNSPGQLVVYLTKYNSLSGKRDTICYHKTLISGTVTAWTNFSIDFSAGYKSLQAPDSCIIGLHSSGNHIGAYLHVDDLSFSGLVSGVVENKTLSDISFFPNPCNEQLYFLFDETVEREKLLIILSDNLGKELVKTNNETINVSHLNSGIYSVTISYKNTIVRKKLAIN